ncbi:hypothetical protein ACIPWF_22685 [Paenarthrobacter sp. NPDC089989]|uniref:hypothetical protein n=1 Tax=unclassified Paenarthrobacter TaxID=2634190 RepID=UPI0038245EF1
MIGPILLGTTCVLFGLLIYAISGPLSRWATDWHVYLREEQKPSYFAKKLQTIRIGAICFLAAGGAMVLMGLLVGLISGHWTWSSTTA